jgi:hypothetical protein
VHGDPVAAEVFARRALAEGPTAGGALASAYTTLSLCAAIDGNNEGALEVLAEGQRTMRELGFGTSHGDAYFESLIATREAALGNQVAARAHATEAVRLAREAQFPMRLTQALTTFARVLYHDDPDTAERALDEVFALGPEAGSPTMVGWALSIRAEFRAAAGDTRGALVLLHQALAAMGDDTTTLSVVRIAAVATTVFADLSEPETAAVLAGAATAGHYARLRLDAHEQTDADLTGAVERLRATFDADAYDTAVAYGAAMSSDDLLRFLRRAIDDALATGHD